MNAPFALTREYVRAVDLRQPDEAARIEGFVAEMRGTLFHRPAWLRAAERGTGQRARGLLAEKGGAIVGWLPLSEVHSPIFGRLLASSGFAVGGGVLAERPATAQSLCRAAEELALRLSCPTIELRGGRVPEGLALAHRQPLRLRRRPRARRRGATARHHQAPARRSAQGPWRGPDRHARMPGAKRCRRSTRCIPKASATWARRSFRAALFEAMIEALDADILTVFHDGRPVSSVLSFYHDGAVMPYWGGGTYAARRLRANERLYYELMCHARRRGLHPLRLRPLQDRQRAVGVQEELGLRARAAELCQLDRGRRGEAQRRPDERQARRAASRCGSACRCRWQTVLGPPIARGLG